MTPNDRHAIRSEIRHKLRECGAFRLDELKAALSQPLADIQECIGQMMTSGELVELPTIPRDFWQNRVFTDRGYHP